MSLSGSTAVITGGANGIGFATAEELLKNGVSKILLLDLTTDLDPTQYAQLKAYNPTASVFYAQCDVTKKPQLEKTLRQDAVQWLGSIDILVNSAGVFECEPARCIGTNLIGLIDCTLIAIDLMTKEKAGNGGFIVNMSSIAGLEPYPVAAVYAASKFGVTGFTRSLGTELMYNQTGVKFAVICPSATDTNLLKTAGDNAFTFPWMEATARKLLKKFTVQKPSAVAECIVKVITEGETGSIWISEAGTMRQIKCDTNKYI
ncbi:alcohol dehydrogenase 2-like [Topomyia yanbarensis]|uniref:alcohol dehydrogenase 2-like n=1 Tax=Topomyia yanbarensis TaxID=2498891 RepID=UPI00273AC639|nr:alcohol dehydrogenase 2-like [Topomyia yanbarensis]